MDMTEKIIGLALFEDVCLGDITTDSIFTEPQEKTAVIVAKQDFILAGTDVAKKVFHTVDPALECTIHFNDSDTIKRDDVIFTVTGDIRSLLTAERVALNFLQRLSGIATLTRKFVSALDNPDVRLVDTRKTTPGWRKIEKDAVRAGGGFNHRFALYDGIFDQRQPHFGGRFHCSGCFPCPGQGVPSYENRGGSLGYGSGAAGP